MTPLIYALLGLAFISFIIAVTIVVAALSLAEDEPLYRVHWRSYQGEGNTSPIPLSEAILRRDSLQDDPMLQGDEFWIEPVE